MGITAKNNLMSTEHHILPHTLFAIHSFILFWESNIAVFTLAWIYQHSKKHTGTINMIRSNYRAIYFCSNCTKEFHTKIDSASKQRCCPRCGILNNPFMEVSAFKEMVKIHITRLRSEEWQFSAFLNIPTLSDSITTPRSKLRGDLQESKSSGFSISHEKRLNIYCEIFTLSKLFMVQ